MRRVRVRKRLHHNDNPRSAKDAFISRSFGWVVGWLDLLLTPTFGVVVGGGGEEHGAHR